MSTRGPRSDAGLWQSLSHKQRGVIAGDPEQKTGPKIALKYGGKGDDKPSFAKWASLELIHLMLKYKISAADVGEIMRDAEAKGSSIKDEYVVRLMDKIIKRGKTTLTDDEKIEAFNTIVNMVNNNINNTYDPTTTASMDKLTKIDLSSQDEPYVTTKSYGRIPLPVEEFLQIQDYITTLGREPNKQQINHALSMLNKTTFGKAMLPSYETPDNRYKLLRWILKYVPSPDEIPEEEEAEEEEIQEPADDEQAGDEQEKEQAEPAPIPTTISQQIEQVTQPKEEKEDWKNVFSQDEDKSSLETFSTSKLDFPTTETEESTSEMSTPVPPALLRKRISRVTKHAEPPQDIPLSGDARMNSIDEYMKDKDFTDAIKFSKSKLAEDPDIDPGVLYGMMISEMMKKDVPMPDKPKTITETIDRVRMITDELRQGNIGFIDFVNDLSSFGRFIRPDEFDKYAESISPYLVGLRDTEGQKLFKNIDQVIGFLHSIYYKQDDGRKNEIRIVKAMRKEAHPQIRSKALQRSAMPVVHHRWIYRY